MPLHLRRGDQTKRGRSTTTAILLRDTSFADLMKRMFSYWLAIDTENKFGVSNVRIDNINEEMIGSLFLSSDSQTKLVLYGRQSWITLKRRGIHFLRVEWRFTVLEASELHM